MTRKHNRTHEEFVKELYQLKPHIEILDKYVDLKTKIHYKNHKTNRIGYGTPKDLLRVKKQRILKLINLYLKNQKSKEIYLIRKHITGCLIKYLQKHIDNVFMKTHKI